MKKNMGLTDRVIRAIVAMILVALIATGTIRGTPGIFLGILAAVLLLTGLVSYCPLYLPFGLNTIRKKLNNKTN